MPTVRDASFDLFRAHGMTTIFGNPGSTELPMLADFPTDFRYVLGLQEAVVVGMADGYAQASGRTTVANLHTAPGVGNAMGAIFNAQANHSPVLVTAGQQVRAQMTLQANLTNRDAIADAAPAGQVGLRAGPRRGRAAGPRPRRPPRRAPAEGPRLRLDPDGRLGRRGRRRRRPRTRSPARSTGRAVADPEAVRGAGRAPRRRLQPGPRRRPRHRRLAAAGTRRSPSPSASACRSGPARRPAAPASASPRTTPTSAASCRRRSARSARRSRATT